VRVARKLQVGLKERRALGNSFAKGRQRILRRVPRGPTMRNYQHNTVTRRSACRVELNGLM